MRVLLAGLFVFIGILIAVTLLSDVMNRVSPILFELGMGIFFIVLILFANVAFNGSWRRMGKFKSEAKYIQELEDEGLLVSTDFHAFRAFEVQEFEDEGAHYFIELSDKSVLYMNGQYLYDYVLIDEDEINQPRRFPCTDFTVKRHRDKGYVVDIICRGIVLETESIDRSFTRAEYRQGKVPEDGDIIDIPFDELKRRFAETR